MSYRDLLGAYFYFCLPHLCTASQHYPQILSHHTFALKIVLTLTDKAINSFYCLKISERAVIISWR
jgi:hypothetical protein